MRGLSWVFTIAALSLIVACFFNDSLIFFAFILSVLAAWADDWANDIELREFMSGGSNKK